MLDLHPHPIFRYRSVALASLTLSLQASLFAADAGPFRFEHRFIDPDAPTSEQVVGFAMTALADLDHDGDLDFIVGHRGGGDVLYWYEYRGPNDWVRHRIGTEHQSDVAAAVLDVDGDGWPDIVCSGVWFRNPQKPREGEFERHVFDPNARGGHDALVADIDGDGRKDVLLMGDGRRSPLKELCWYPIPKDPTKPWVRHSIGPPVHGAITPGAAFDVDGDGDIDVVRADTWFENVDGRGLTWQPHANVPVGRVGPYGMCVRAAAADLDGDGRMELVVADADILECGVFILRNADGRGGRWEKQALPQSFVYGSLHSLAVADFDGDGDLDILVNEQEDMLPADRTNPRWVIWENQGDGQFVERIILDRQLGGHELVVGDVDGDGDIDIVSKPWRVMPWNGAGGRMHIDFLENMRIDARTANAAADGAPPVATEFLVFQGDRTFTEADGGFHYYFREGQPLPDSWPKDWTSPIDYRKGKWHVRVELKSTPKDLPITFQTCIWMHDADGESDHVDELESCGRPHMEMSSPGVYTAHTLPMDAWWHKNSGKNAIDITRPDRFKRLGLVLRTADGCYITPYAKLTPNCWEQRADYLPIEFHVTIVVSKGATFSGWKNYASSHVESDDR